MFVFIAGASTTRPVEGEIQRCEEIVGQAVGKAREQIRGGGRDDEHVVVLRDANVLHGAAEHCIAGALLVGPKAGDDFASGERGKRERLNELARRLRHDDLDGTAALAERPSEFRRLVRGNSTAYAQRDFHAECLYLPVCGVHRIAVASRILVLHQPAADFFHRRDGRLLGRAGQERPRAILQLPGALGRDDDETIRALLEIVRE